MWKRLLKLGQRLHCVRRALPTGANWTADLGRGAQETYVSDPISKYEAFDADHIAEPPRDAPVVSLRSALPSSLVDRYANIDELIPHRPDVLAELPALNRRYNKVLGDRSEWLRYLTREDVRPLWVLELASQAKASCSVAAVKKREGTQLRKILMVVPFNTIALSVDEFMQTNVDYGLMGPAALAQLRLISGSLATAAADESNAFSSVEVPFSWRAYQAGPRVRAGDLPASWTNNRFRPSDWVRPQYTRLAMGCTHAVWLLMLINLAAADKVVSLLMLETKCFILNRPDVFAKGVRIGLDTAAIYIHVDDIGCFSGSISSSNQLMHTISD
jgi:hypothetical protein